MRPGLEATPDVGSARPSVLERRRDTRDSGRREGGGAGAGRELSRTDTEAPSRVSFFTPPSRHGVKGTPSLEAKIQAQGTERWAPGRPIPPVEGPGPRPSSHRLPAAPGTGRLCTDPRGPG